MSSYMSTFRIDGRTAAVTGGGSGIGRAAALALSEAGANVALLDKDATAGAAVAAEIAASGGKSRFLPLDITREQDVEGAVAQIAAAFGSIDILVNSAGTAIRAPTMELSLDDWNRVVEVNMTAVFLCTKHVARTMIAGGRPGSIINIGSIMGISGGGIYPNISYHATKGAIVTMTRALAVEWAQHRIRVNAVAPTWVRTPLIGPLLQNPELVRRIEAMTPLGRLAEPEDVAGAILYLASPASAMVTGHVLAVDGGFLAQ
jgi:NAD(P)-dependent dehydrogenase (short-subunit alcohol dehydrogenase family)